MVRLPAWIPPLRSARWCFLRLVGLAALIAFASLLPQISGLWGRGGILPVAPMLAASRGRVGFFHAPTVFWLGASAAAMKAAALAGMLASALLLVGLAPRYCLVAIWALYLSFVTVGGVFLGYQWDALLLETCALAAFWAPGGLLPRDGPPPVLGRLVLAALLFKLMFLSGFVKLASGDPTWRGLSALDYHFWTQPLPTGIGLFVAHLPRAVLHAMCALTLAIELVLPFFAFGPLKLRRIAFVGLVALQAAIALTGNYGFFNLLTVALCVPLFETGRPSSPPRWPEQAIAAALLALLVLPLFARLWPRAGALRPVAAALELEEPWRTFNAYGLFAVMTTSREELAIEGSDDLAGWKRYRFAFKPSPEHPSRFVAPYQPRLDWQMWFAALGTCRDNPWLLSLADRLLHGAGPVGGLFAENPFPDRPPRYLRVTGRDYRLGRGASWRVGAPRRYCPVLTLDGGRLAAVSERP